MKLLKQLCIICTFLTPSVLQATPISEDDQLWLSDDELSEYRGQALFNLAKTVGTGSGGTGDAGVTFTRLSIGASIDVNANIDLIELGNYEIPNSRDGRPNSNMPNPRGLDADIRFRDVSLGCLGVSGGCVDGSGLVVPGLEHLHLEDPYIEFAYKNDGTSKRELIGLRLGFDQVSGWVAGTIDSISGDMEGTCKGGLCGLNSLKGEIHSPRTNYLYVNESWSGPQTLGGFHLEMDLSSLHRLPLGKASTCAGSVACAPTRNMYLGFQTEPLNYPMLNASGKQGQAKPGFWINLQDNVLLNTGDVLNAFLGSLPAFDNCRGSAGVRNGVNACRM